MGYRYKKVNGRKILVESKQLFSKKICFLKKYLQYSKVENINFIYLDETRIYENGSQVRLWVRDGDLRANPSKIPTEGKRSTVLHAGHKNGFLKGCDYFLHSKIEHRDYHRTINGDLFKNWVENQLIPALRELSGKTVIIMNNAPYHSVVLNKLPTSNVFKSKLQEWTSSQNIIFDQSLNKKKTFGMLLNLIWIKQHITGNMK
jgi:hypothetical protein